jgi:hypothetical protein
MAKFNLSTKRVQIDKANARVVVMVAVAAVVATCSLVGAKTLLTERAYRSRVISKKEKALTQLKNNIKATDSLVVSYKAFVAKQPNVLGKNSSGNGEGEGDNAKIILDALPSKYDFPALATSLEKLLSDRRFAYKIDTIGGTDDEVAQGTVVGGQAIEIPFKLGVSSSYDSLQALLSTLEHSVRPFNIGSLSFIAGDNKVSLTLAATTYYQPEKTLNISTEVVK